MRGLTNVMPQAETMSHAATHYAGGADPLDLTKLGAIPASEKGKAGGTATLGEDGKVPKRQLPDTVDFNSLDNFPTAAVGQFLKVTAVDKNGNPTAWEMAEALNTDLSNLAEAADLSGLAATMGASKIAYGSYVGTGKYGANDYNQLTFDFAPSIIIFLGYVNSGNGIFYPANAYDNGSNYRGTLHNEVVVLATITTQFSSYKGPTYINPAHSYAKKSADGKTFSWYNRADQQEQQNSSGYTYYYMAIS